MLLELRVGGDVLEGGHGTCGDDGVGVMRGEESVALRKISGSLGALLWCGDMYAPRWMIRRDVKFL